MNGLRLLSDLTLVVSALPPGFVLGYRLGRACANSTTDKTARQGAPTPAGPTEHPSTSLSRGNDGALMSQDIHNLVHKETSETDTTPTGGRLTEALAARLEAEQRLAAVRAEGVEVTRVAGSLASVTDADITAIVARVRDEGSTPAGGKEVGR